MQLFSNLSILSHCLSLGLQWTLTFSSPVATAEFSTFVKNKYHMISFIWASLIAQFVKIPPAMQEIPVRFLGGDDLLQKDRLLTPVFLSFLCGSAGKESACNAGELGSVRGLERSLGEGKSHQLQYSGLENFMGIHGVAKSRTQLSDFHFPFHTWNLKGKKKRFKWTYLQSQNRPKDRENKLIFTKGKRSRRDRN